MVQDYREHNVSDEELAAVYSKMSESEIEEAKMKIMREIGGDVFAGAFFNAPAKNSDVMNWREIGAVSASSADNKKITLSINIGYSDNIAFDDVAISDYLRQYIGRKNSDDFAPPNESKLKSDIRDSLNSDFFKSGKIRQVAIMDLSIK